MMLSLPFIHLLDERASDFEIITIEQLQAMLQTSKGSKIITLITVTEPELYRLTPEKEIENPYYNNCVKVSRINGVINFHYSNSVNNQLEREGKEADFIPAPRKWGTRLKNSPFVSHVTKEGKHKLYLEVKIEKSLGHKFYNPTTGLLIPEKQITPWLKKKEDARKFQGTDKEIILRDYSVENIATIHFDKKGYIIKENLL